MRLAGRVALVTGAASGIGRAVAEEFARQGARVWAADADEEGLRTNGADGAQPIRLDVTREEEWEAVFREIPRLDVLVASAGVAHAQPIAETSIEQWRRVMAVNVEGSLLGIQYAARAMAEAGGGSIILLGSASGIKAASGAAAYCASKAALRMLARVAALELKDRGVRVNTISPAGVATPMWTRMPFWPALVSQHGGETGAWKALGGVDPEAPPLKRMALPEEIARVALFLASGDAANMTGAELVVDAGYTL